MYINGLNRNHHKDFGVINPHGDAKLQVWDLSICPNAEALRLLRSRAQLYVVSTTLPLEEFDVCICESFGVLANDDPEVSPTLKVEHPELEIAWLMHCPQLTGQVWMNGDPNVLGIYMNLWWKFCVFMHHVNLWEAVSAMSCSQFLHLQLICFAIEFGALPTMATT